MGTDLWQCTLMSNLYCCPPEKPGRQHHDLICYSVTLSWQWPNQSFPYPNNVDHLARKQQVSILYHIRLVAVRTHGNFIVLSHPETRPPHMAWYPTQLRYPDNEPISPWPILIMLSARLGSYQFLSHWIGSTRLRTHEVQTLSGGLSWLGLELEVSS